jgi:hypothetical protein
MMAQHHSDRLIMQRFKLSSLMQVTRQKTASFVCRSRLLELSATATTGTLPTADGTMTIADAASPTNAELLEYCRELESKVNSLLAFASAHGLMGT